jgi:hypothetical protein
MVFNELPEHVAAEMERLGRLSPATLQSAIPELQALMRAHPTLCGAITSAREALAVQRPEMGPIFDALEQEPAPEAQLALLESLRELSSSGTRLVFSRDPHTPELLKRTATHPEVDMVDEDGRVLVATVILFCDGCHHLFNVGETWHGCAHYTLCAACHGGNQLTSNPQRGMGGSG